MSDLNYSSSSPSSGIATVNTIQSIPGVINWTAVSPPTGIGANYVYQSMGTGTTGGNLIRFYFWITASGAGTAVTGVNFTLPPGIPLPLAPPFASQHRVLGVADAYTLSSSTPDTTGAPQGQCTLFQTGGNYLVYASFPSIAGTEFVGQLYWEG